MALTKKQEEIIEQNLKAYVANFGEVRIERADYGKGFYVFSPADRENYVQYCENIDYLNGWLYGAVQAANGLVQPIWKQEQSIKPEKEEELLSLEQMLEEAKNDISDLQKEAAIAERQIEQSTERKTRKQATSR